MHRDRYVLAEERNEKVPIVGKNALETVLRAPETR